VARQQGIQFLDWAGRRVAFDVSGDGPFLVAPAWWVSHLEAEASDLQYTRFWRGLSEGFTLVRYDRLGVGLSDRAVGPADFTLDAEIGCLEALFDRLAIDRATLLGGSSGGCTAIAFAARHPERVERLVLYGAYARGVDVASADVRAAVLAAVRSHWGLGSRMLAQIFLGDEAQDGQERFARRQREAADAETAAGLLEFVYGVDVSADVAHVEAQAVVAHKRFDRAVPYALGRRLAAALPNATFVPLAGSAHLPWYENPDAVVRACRSGLGEPATIGPNDEVDPLSERERQVLALVARGLTDQEIAEQLVISRHTVHRHVANVRQKLGSTSRSAAVAEAARLGLL
jgi:pimeloyl-ACP methyl ester carboxylesterase/DNA-binding CsgD family transcriptional regulator